MSEFIMQPWYKKKKRNRYKSTEVTTPFVAFSGDPPWKDLGLTCPDCGAECELKDSDPPGLQYISHCGKTWLRGDIKFRSLKEADEAQARATSE